MIIEKYKNDGWGLSKLAFKNLYDITNKLVKDGEKLNILEFGSGISTKFFVDIILDNDWQELSKITSFDNDASFMPHFDNNLTNDILELHKRRLLECDSKSFEDMFQRKMYIKEKMFLRKDLPHARQKNCFYEILPKDLKYKYNLIVIDGPHGNGRSIAYLHFKNFIKIPCYVLVDDFTHYDFADRFYEIFKAEEVYKNIMSHATKIDKWISKFSNKKFNDISKWNRGGNYIVFKINAIK